MTINPQELMKLTKTTATKKSALTLVKANLKHLSYDELNNVIEWALRYRKEKIGIEELRLIKEKENIELKLKELKDLDKKGNGLS